MVRKITYSIIFCTVFFSAHEAFAQSKNKIAVSAEFVQVKDRFNHGMLFNGPQVGFQYQRLWNFSAVELSYNPKIALGIPFSREMAAVNINFTPIDASCLRYVYQSDSHSLKTGLNFATNYSYQLYPYLQSARLFWFGEIGFSPAIEYQYKWEERAIRINLQNSVFGFISRTNDYDPYFFSLEFIDFFVSPHKNLQFGSFDKYNHAKVHIEYTSNTLNSNSLAFGMEYIGAYFNVHFQSLIYQLQWRKFF